MTLYPSRHAISRSSSSPATSGRPQLHLTDRAQGPPNPTTPRGCWDDSWRHFQIVLRWVDRRRRCLIAFLTFANCCWVDRRQHVPSAFRTFASADPTVARLQRCLLCASSPDSRQPSNFLTLCEKVWIHSYNNWTQRLLWFSSPINSSPSQKPLPEDATPTSTSRNNATTNRPHFQLTPACSAP